MRKQYNKLVRDHIPEIIRRDGRQCSVEVMPEEEYVRALKDKLIEEAKEAAAAKPEELVKELADLYEVSTGAYKTWGSTVCCSTQVSVS